MLISCPKCETTFELPDNLFKPGKKARCSQCGNVFQMGGESAEAQSPAQGKKAKKSKEGGKQSFFSRFRKFIIIGVAAVLLLLLGCGVWLIAGSFFGGEEEAAQVAAEQKAEEVEGGEGGNAEQQSLLASIALTDVRQFFVKNVHMGRIMVIQGLAKNISESKKAYIAIEARLLDANKKTLVSVQQLCGVPLTLFQIESLSEAELKELLNSRVTILINNTNVPSDGLVPFVVLFSSPPAAMDTFEVRVIDVRESPDS